MDFISNNQWIIPLSLFSIIVIIGIVLGAKNIRREKNIQKEVRKLGLFTGTQEPIKRDTKLPSFFLFTPQSSHVQFRQIRNIIKGRINNLDFVMFDYISKFSKGRINTATVSALPLSVKGIPDFRLVPTGKLLSIHKRVLDKSIKKHSQRNDAKGNYIKFTSEPEFSKNYLLYSRDEQTIRKLFDADTLKLLSQQSFKGWSIICGNGWMNLCHNDRTVKPEKVQKFLEESKLIYDTILRK